MNKIIAVILSLSTLFAFSACTVHTDNSTSNKASSTTCDTTPNTTVNNLMYEQITGEQAKALMDSEANYIIIDARTQSEYDEGHIPSAILIPEYEIEARAEKELLDKDQLILVYCRSGRRSKIAAEALANLGYTNVKEFGGIIDWKYEIVK